MKDFFKSLITSDGKISVVLTVFLAIFGGFVAFGFEATPIIAVICSIICALIAFFFKESRRSTNEEKPKYYFVPYIVGGVIGVLSVWLMANNMVY